MIRIDERVTAKLPGITSLFVSFDFQKIIVEELKLLPTTNYNPVTHEWEIPLTSLTALIDRLCIHDEIELHILTDEIEEFVSYDLQQYKTTPFEYQKQGINYGLNHDKWLLLDSPGLGKTLQLIYLAQELKERKGVEHCLIVCGINTLKTNWKAEIEKHSNLSCRILGERINTKGQCVIDGVAARLEQLKNPIDEFFVITNVETLREDKIIQAIKKNKHNKFDMIVFDEVHKVKDCNSAQGRNLLKLNTANYVIGATGTLLLNNPLDAFVPLKWIGAEKANQSTFKYYYCTFGGEYNNTLVGYKNLSVLQDQINKYSLRRTKDILDLPPKNIINEYIDMAEDQQKFYDEIKEGIIKDVDKVRMSTANLLAMVGRLRQATACPSILTTKKLSATKLDRAEELADAIISNGDKVVIFSTFKPTVYELVNRLSKRYKVVIGTGDQTDFEIEAAKKQFQEDASVKIFIGTHQKCGTGITLTAASYLIFIDHPWTEAETTQCEDRIHRIGSKNPVFIYRLICKNTIDERVLELVNDKGAIADYVVDEKITAQGLDSLRKYIEDLQI